MRITLMRDGRCGKCGVWLAVLLGLIAAAGVAGWIAMSGWIGSGGLTGYLKTQLSETAGAPVEFERVGFVPFTRVSLEGLKVAGDQGPGAPPTLTCRAVRLGFSLSDLLQRRLRFERLTVDAPHLAVREGRTGLGPAKQAGDKPRVKSGDKPGGKSEVAIEGATAEWSIDRFEVNDGVAEGQDAAGAQLWLAEDLDLQAVLGTSTTGKLRAKGDAAVGRVTVAKGFTLTDVKSPFGFEAERVELPGLRFGCYGGSGSAKVTANAAGSAPKFEADLEVTGVDAGALAEGLGGDASRVSGTIALKFAGGGEAGDLDRLRGSGSFAIEPAKFSGSEMLRGLGTLLMLPELANSEFSSVHGSFEIRKGQVNFSEIRTEPRERLQIVASGSVAMDGALDLKGTLSVKSATLNLAPLLTQAGGTPSADGFMDVPFTVKGTTESPRVSLAPAAATGIVGGLLKNFFGSGKHQGDKAAQPAQPAEPAVETNPPPAEKPVDALKKLLPFGK